MKLNRLDALRGFAALYVVLHHAIPRGFMLGPVEVSVFFRFGQEAVILFFLLSGFVVNFAHSRSTDQTFQTYFLKRFLRIYVPLIAVFILAWSLRSMEQGRLLSVNLRDLGLNLLMLQDIGSLKPHVVVEPFLGDGPLWSLSYEWWFYMLYFPVHRWLSPPLRDRLVLLGAVGAALAYQWSPTFVPRLLMYASIWWCGVMLADAYRAPGGLRAKALIEPLLAMLAICVIQWWAVVQARHAGTYSSIGVHPALELRHHAFAIMAVLCALAWRAIGWRGFDRLLSPFLKVAPVSYALYISHHFFVVEPPHWAWLKQSWFGPVVLVLALWLFAHVVELRLYPAVQRWVMARHANRIKASAWAAA